jgi:CubicO group peptidase (beta-lactamase class C family)
MKSSKTTLLFLSLPFSFILLAAITKKYEANASENNIAAINEIVIDEMAKRYYIGCAVAVVKNGKIIHQKAYGHLDEQRKQPVTTNTIFRWASISKTLTAAAAWKLIEDCKFSINSKVSPMVSYWPSNGNKDLITVGHLMSHRSGINQYNEYDEGRYISPIFFNAQLCVNVFSYAGLRFTPNTQHYYSTFGYNLLGAVIDRKASNGYVGFIETEIKNPNNLTSLTYLSSGLAGYELACNGGLNRQEEGSVLWKLPGGGWASNIEDLAKFMKALMQNKILKNTSQMWQPIIGLDNDNYCYGLQNETKGSEIRVSHGGANQEISTEMAFYPSSGLGVVVMINGDKYCDASNLAKRIEKYYGKKVSADENGFKNIMCQPDRDCPTPTGMDRLVGVWRPDAGETIWRRRLGFDQLPAEWKWLDSEAGYDLIDLETYLIDGVRYWDGIFKKQNKKTALWRNFSQDEFHDKWVEMNNSGYRLIDLETYEDNGTRYWAGVFEEGTGAYGMYRNYSSATFIDKHKELQRKELSLIDVEVFKDKDDNLLWSGVWRAGKATHFYYNKSLTDFNLLIKAQAADGYMLLDVETYLIGSSRMWAGVFDKFDKPCAFEQDRNYCQLAKDDSLFIIQRSPQYLHDIEIYK